MNWPVCKFCLNSIYPSRIAKSKQSSKVWQQFRYSTPIRTLRIWDEYKSKLMIFFSTLKMSSLFVKSHCFELMNWPVCKFCLNSIYPSRIAKSKQSSKVWQQFRYSTPIRTLRIWDEYKSKLMIFFSTLKMSSLFVKSHCFENQQIQNTWWQL